MPQRRGYTNIANGRETVKRKIRKTEKSIIAER
nr:MAG TPA: hypothetical protein [Caudoviricetes sp.]DAU19146.1 MAG TPA: hypothetical protein [Caudoviricetes sp.]